MTVAQALKQAQQEVALALTDGFSDGLDADLTDAMRYALEGGKCLRGFLVLEGAALCGIAPQVARVPALAIECMHAYSLIHDDLPCMDDDDLRRGKPTVHRRWNEHTAVLAGDALQALAFELTSSTQVAAEHALALTRGLGVAAGHMGMVGGQMLDIAAETVPDQNLDQITQIQAGKTGALITWSASAGAVMAGAPPLPLATYGQHLGLAFQIADDILDVEGDAAKIGKAVRKDADAGKATFVSLLGMDEAKRRARDHVTLACDALSPYAEAADRLRQVAAFVVTRES